MDDRFSHVFKDPRFQRVPIKERKLKIDERFKGMFKDKRFSLKYTVDKRGRPIKSSTSENLQKYYQLSDEDEDGEADEDAASSSEDEKKKRKEVKKKKKKEIEKKVKKSISNGADSKTDAGIVLDAEKCADDSLIENKKSGKGLIKKMMDNTQKKRKLSATEDALLTSSKKIKKSKKKIVEEVIEADEGEEEEEEEEKDEVDEEEEDEENDVSEDEESEDSESGLGSGPDLARGIGNESSSSETSDSDSESDDETVTAAVEEIVHDWGEFDKDVALTSDLTRRLAACNMDWDNLTAEDLFVVVNSFKPPDGVLLSVKIFLSDFGKERLEEEVSKGPAELAQIAQDDDDDEISEDETRADEENSEGNSFHNEKLREYQLKRMKYYYAVIECDTTETANQIYSELDGAEYESSKTCFDLRFIPDDMEFEEEAKDVCTHLPNKDLYKPNQFLSTALSEAEVALTWDETDKKRLETTTKNYNKKSEIKLEDFKDYLALSSEEEEEGDAEKNGSDASLISDNELSDDNDASSDEGVKSNIKKYKKLLEGIEETERKKEDKQIEVTWDIGLKEKTEEALKTKQKKKSASPWNEFLDKLKEKKKKRKTKLKALKKNAESKEAEQTFSDDDIPSDVDFNDPYFKSELISDPNQKSKTQKKKEKKANRLKKLEGETDSGLTTEEKEQRKQEMAELALLMADEDDINPKAHFDYEKIIKKESKKKSKKNIKAAKKEKDDFKLELNDDRFSSIYTSSAFNIDRSAPEYKKSAAMEALIDEKLRRRYIEKEFPERKEQKSSKLPADGPVSSQPSTSVDQSVNSLVRSIKTKTKNFNFSKTKPNIKGQIWKKLPKDL